MPYDATDHERPSTAALRERIPGWGADLDPADRPAVPRERTDLTTGAHWTVPDDQPELRPRERSIEHTRLTPVFGTAAPLHGLSGSIRGFAYARFSEGRAAHWLLLVLGDRVDSLGARARSIVERRPDNPIAETGVLAEGHAHPLSSRFGRGRADVKHLWLDPLVVAGPVALAAALLLLRRARR